MKIAVAFVLGMLPLFACADQIDDLCRQELKSNSLPGMVVGLVKDGKLETVRSYGKASIELNAPMTRDSVFEIGSMTKQFTAACLLLLHEDGKVNLDDPIGKFLTDLPEAIKPLTIRRVLSHTSGMADMPGILLVRTQPMSYDDFIEKFLGKKLDFPTGTSWSYSNAGYYLAGALVEKVSGMKLAEFMKKRIFEPLKMSHTQTTNPNLVIPGRVRGYNWDGKKYNNAIVLEPSVAGGAGFLVSTVDDLAKWDKALSSTSLLKETSLKEFFEPVKLVSGYSSNYAFGWMIHTFEGKRLVEHGGNTLGISSELFRAPTSRRSVIVLANKYGYSGTELAWKLLSVRDGSWAVETSLVMKDPHPEYRGRFALALKRLAVNNPDYELFSPDLKGKFGTFRGLAEKVGLINLSKTMKSMTFVNGELVDNEWLARYLVSAGNVQAYLSIRFDTEGRVLGIDPIYRK